MKDDKILESELNQNVDVGTAEDVEAVMKKYDRESNTRVWEGKPGVIVRWCSILFFLVQHLRYAVQYRAAGGAFNHIPRHDSDSGIFELSD